LALFSLPLMLMFAAALRRRSRGVAALAAILAIAPIHFLKIDKWPVNASYNVITVLTCERLNAIAAQAIHLAAAQDSLRIVLTGAVVFGLLCLVLSAIERARARLGPQPEAASISWQKLGMILGPFSAAYVLFATVHGAFFDRYFLPLFAILLLVLTRYYQQRIPANAAWAWVLLIGVFAGFSLVAIHDAFSRYRGFVAAAGEIRSSGVPATAILGPQPYEGWAQLEKAGRLNYPPKVSPDPSALQSEEAVPAYCDKDLYFLILLGQVPSIQPAYAVSLNPQECGGQVAFPPVKYSTWIAPRTNWIYAVRLPPSISH
jgi:hypothetical protein